MSTPTINIKPTDAEKQVAFEKLRELALHGIEVARAASMPGKLVAAPMWPIHALAAWKEAQEGAMWRSIAEELYEALDTYVPDRICSCHISPPCSYCVEHGHAHEAMKGYAEAKARVTDT